MSETNPFNSENPYSLASTPISSEVLRPDPEPSELTKAVYAQRGNHSGPVRIMFMAENAAKDEVGRSFAFDLEEDDETGETYIVARKAIAEYNLTPERQAELQAKYEAAQSMEAEPAVSTEVAEKIGDVGLGAVGIENPGEVNEHATSFKKGEISALREAAREKEAMESNPPIITGVPNFDKPIPVIPGLAQMMAEQPPVIPDLAAKMSGEVAPEAPKSAEQRLNELNDQFSQDDRMALREYADASISKKRAQQDGDGQRSTLEGQYMGQALKKMSPKAQAVVRQFTSLYEQA